MKKHYPLSLKGKPLFKGNNFLNSLKRYFFLLLLLFAMPQEGFGANFLSSYYTLVDNPCDGSVEVTIRLFHKNPSSVIHNHFRDLTKLQMNNGSGWVNLMDFNFSVINNLTNTWKWTGLAGVNDYNVGITPTGGRSMLVVNQDDNNDPGFSQTGWLDVTFKIYLKPEDIGKDIDFNLVGDWRTGPTTNQQVDETESFTFEKTTNPAQSSVSASNKTLCTGVEVSWQLPAGADTLCPNSVAQIFRDDQTFMIAEVDASDLSYLDSLALPGVPYDYEVRFGTPLYYPSYIHFGFIPLLDIANGILYSNFSERSLPLAAGMTKNVPDTPDNFNASDDNCDGTIDLIWVWSDPTLPDSFQLFRNNAPYGPLIAGFKTSATDTSVTRGQLYTYSVQAKNNCGFGANSAPDPGLSPSDPSPPTGFVSSIVTGQGIQLNWNSDPNTQTFQLVRTQLGGSGSINLPSTPLSDLFYVDGSVIPCQTYEYRLKAFNACSTTGVESNTVVNDSFEPDISNALSDQSFTVSKGYFPDRVELTWGVPSGFNSIEYYKIYRKIAYSTDDSVLIVTLPTGSNLHNDFLALAGVLYQYTLVGETQCEAVPIYSNILSKIGFRSPFGTVSGQVSYTGGVAVKNVKISASSSSGSTGSALDFDGASSLLINHTSNFNSSNGMTLEMWIKPTSHASDFSLVEKTGSFSLKHIAGNYVFDVGTQSVQVSDAFVSLNNYNQLTATLYSDTLKLFLNGLKVDDAFFLNSNLVNGTFPINLGQNYQGLMDEFRFFIKGKSEEQVLQDFSRTMNGGEGGLRIYLKMNEGAGDYAYDFSRTSAVSFNKNHAMFQGNPNWTNDVPSNSNLAVATYTDAQGNYVLNIPYTGAGETFVLTPSFLVHNFAPSTRALFIGEGSMIFNNIDFADISSFTVQGSLFYENTSCAVEGASLLVDGNLVISNGQIAKTDAQGNFIIQVPIGKHFVTVEKSGHFMNVGRFPELGTYDFQNDLAGMNFKDSTLLKVVGRVVGGLKQASYIPGLGKSKNNIGQARIVIQSQQGNGCYTDTLYTDAVTGEYTTYLPPLRYIPSVIIPSNLSINFGILNLVDLSSAPGITSKYDTIGSVIDSIQFNKQLDYIYRVDPQIVVKDKDGVQDFIGDTIYRYIHPNGDSIVRNLRLNPLPWPVFNGIGEEKWYTCLITAYEEYRNNETNKLDTVPTTDGKFVLNNNLCEVDSGEFNLSEFNSLDSLQYMYYKFKLGAPNFNENVSVPQYNFVKTFEVNILFPSGNSIAWKPDVFRGNPSGQFPNVYDRIFRGYVLGTKSDGQQFVTAGPQVPEYVLRDPPGSNSSAKREIGTTKSTNNDWSWNFGGSVGAEDQIFAGEKSLVGIGVAKAIEVEANVVAGFSATVTGKNAGSQSVVITNTQEWGSNSGTDLPGRGSDLYIGKSKNVTFGISETLTIIPDSICPQTLACIGVPFDSLRFTKAYGLSIVPGGYETQFIYNENQIKTYLIPSLENLRNVLIETDPRYTLTNPNLSVDDPTYGKNNDDPIFNTSINSLTSDEMIAYILKIGDSTYIDQSSTFINSLTLRVPSASQKLVWAALDKTTEPTFQVLNGPSYFFDAQNLEDSLTNDSVRWINNQIKHWENAIMLNEWEKVNISKASTKEKLKQVEYAKLVGQYREKLITYEALSAVGAFVSGVSGLYTVLTPAVGSAFIGYATFGVTSGTGIATAEVYDDVLQFQSELQLINTKFNQTPANYSISGGNTFTSSMTHESATSITNSIEYGMSATFAYEIAGKVSNTGVGFKKSLGLNFTSGRDWSTASGSSESVSFTLDEPDQGDFFSVDVHPSLLGWGPVFKLRPGGATACPHEDAQLTEYYFDEPANAGNNPNYPSFELNARTFQIDKPTMSVAPSLLTNIPIANAAAFNLTINNESEANFPRLYTVALHSPSNPFGAIVKIDGVVPNVDVSIPPQSSINKVVTINKGPGPVYDYDSILILVYAPCQYEAGTSDNVDIVDSVYISAHFLPTCTDVEFAYPNNQWVLNNSFQDTMPVSIVNYDINFYDFKSIKLNYKPSSSPTWVTLQTFFKDTTGMNNPQALVIPTNAPATSWDWETDQIVDGAYDLQLLSHCALVDKVSLIHSGVMDRINPHPFGTPSPADGILDPNDDISIRFNEPIDLGSLTSLNFDIRGVINGAETTHASNLYFDGVNDFVEITGGAPLQQRDFTIEFSVKRGTLGNEAIITQGPDGNEQIYIGFDAGNHLQCKINGQSVNSLNTYVDNEWHYFAVAYSYDNEALEIYEASGTTTASIVNTGSTSMYEKYQGADKLLIGKDAASGSHFTGNLDDVRIWNTARSLNEFSLTKSIQLSANEPGLLYNWRFDEAEGIFAKDHVRSRDGIIFGAEWTVEPGGNAYQFVDSNYVRIQKGDVNITQGMDYTLEFWYNSTQATAASMISTGKGDGLGPDSLYAWNIAKDAAGLIHVYHDGQDFVATNSNTFDGEWHHFALVLNRQGNLTSYLDGNLENSVQSTPYKDLGGPAFYLGARGYYNGSLETADNFYQGFMDEFRFWDASRKFEQISRDKNNRMKGDEYALRIYMPFEDYQLDPTGIPILTPSLDEQIDVTDTLYVVTTPNGDSLTALTPKIKIQRPVESIAFTYSVNNDEIIITPTTNQALIENVTLDVTVKNVKDLHGNKMESPKTWIAYMDKNQVIWQDDLLTFDKAFGANLSFTSGISNEGGAAKNFTIENLPDWLTVTPTSGIIMPNSQMAVNFVVDPNVNIGDYSQDVHLLTDFGFPEKLTIDLKVREDEPNWSVNPADFDFSMNIIGYLKIKNVVSTSPEDILAVFVDDECRGLAHLTYATQLDRYLVYLSIYSNATNGEDLSFKIWDASSGTMFTEVEPMTIPFVENNLIGTTNNPQLFETNYEIAFDVPLVAGWNWVSDFLLNVDSTDLDKTMESLESVTGDEIKTLTHGFSSYLNETGLPIGWSGDINGEGIRPELGYKLKISQNDTLVLKGDILDPTSRIIHLTKGWNWIGFVSIRNQSVTQALGNLNPSYGDVIKSKSQFAFYDSQLGWVGDLLAMKPGQGFMYFSADTIDFVYPFAGMFKSGKEVEQNIYTNDTWTVDDSRFASNMTGIAKINSDCDYLLNNQELTLGVFDNTGVARGISPIEMGGNVGRSFLTVAGDMDEKLSLNILDNSTKKVYGIAQVLEYAPNKHLGTLSNPWELAVSDETCFKMKADAGVISDYFKVYPTIIESNLTLDYIGHVQDLESTARLYNVWGQKVWESGLKIEQGFNRIELNFGRIDLAPGVYHFILDSNGSTETAKLMSK